jgi:hypothetical protein
MQYARYPAELVLETLAQGLDFAHMISVEMGTTLCLKCNSTSTLI